MVSCLACRLGLLAIVVTYTVLPVTTQEACSTTGLTVENGEINRDVIEQSIWAVVLSAAAYNEDETSVCNEISRYFDGQVPGFNFPTEIQRGWTDATTCRDHLQIFSQNVDGDLETGTILDNILVYTRPISADENICYVAVRGTDGGIDALQNIDQTTSEVPEASTNMPPPNGNCRAANAFQRSLFLEPPVTMANLNAAVQTCVASCANGPCTLITTGHSQGAAAGAVAGAYYHEYNPMVITFAQPGTFATEGCDRIPSHRYLRYGNTDEYDTFLLGLLYDPVARLFLDGAFSDQSGHLVWLSASNSGGVPHYPPKFRQGLVTNFALSLPFVSSLHSVESHAVRTSDLWRFVQSGNAFVPKVGWNNGRMCQFDRECRGRCESTAPWPLPDWSTRVWRCTGGVDFAPSPSPPGQVVALCKPKVRKMPLDGCQVTITVEDVDAGSTSCANKQLSTTTLNGLSDQLVTLTVTLGTQEAMCTSMVEFQLQTPVLYCDETMTVRAISTGRSPFIEPEDLGFGFDPNGVERVIELVGEPGGVPLEGYEELLLLYEQANATGNFREFYEVHAPELAAEYNLTELYSDLTGVVLSADTTGELEPGSYSITLTAQEDVCMQTKSCVTPLTVLPFIATKAPTIRGRPAPRPRVKPRGEQSRIERKPSVFSKTLCCLLSSGKLKNKHLPNGMWKRGYKHWKKGKLNSMSKKKHPMKGKSSMSKKSRKKYRHYPKGKGKNPAQP